MFLSDLSIEKLTQTEWAELILFLLFSIPIVLTDIREKRIPNMFTYPGIAVFLIVRLTQKEYPFGTVLLTPCVGFFFIFLLFLFSRAKIGLGDAKYSAFIALVCGLPEWVYAILIASLSGLLFALVMILIGRMRPDQRVAFAPFLTLGGIIAFFLKA